MNADFHALIEKHLDAMITAAEAGALAQAMAGDRTLADSFAARTRLDADLVAATRESGRTVLYTRRMERAEAETNAARTRKRLPLKSIAAVAGLAVLAGAGWRLLDEFGRGGIHAKKGRPVPVSGSGGEIGNTTALAGASPAMDSATLKRLLRRFFVSGMALKQQPVSVALAALDEEWRSGASSGVNSANVTFSLADDVRRRWQKPGDEPVVSLEIPSISLLTNLELLAAQAGLKAVISSDRVILEDDPRANDAKERTWTIPLSRASLAAFMKKSASANAVLQDLLTMGNIYADFIEASRAQTPSWMTMPSQRAFINELSGQDIWNDYGLIRRWIETGSQVTSAEQEPADSVQLGSSVLAGDLLADISAGLWTGENLTAVDPLAAAQLGIPAPEVTESNYADYDGDGVLDMYLSPHVVEFNGFIEYQQPDVHSGNGAAGAVALADSGLILSSGATQSDDSGNLSRLLAVHGMPSAAAVWDPDSGILTARGKFQCVNAARLAAAAIEESATAGVSVAMKVIEWKDGHTLPDTRTDMILRPANAMMILTPQEADAMLRLPSAIVSSAPLVRAPCDTPLELRQKANARASLKENPADKFEIETCARLSSVKRIGDSFVMTVNIECSRTSGNEVEGGVRSPVGIADTEIIPLKVPDGAWIRFDVPPKAGAGAASVLLHIQSAKITPE